MARTEPIAQSRTGWRRTRLPSSRRQDRSAASRGANRALALRTASLLVVVVSWELWGRVNPYFVSFPSAILASATKIFVPVVIPALLTTLSALLVGMVIAVPLGMAIGFAMGRVRLLDVALTPYVNAIYATPRIALIPILVLWLGIDFNLRIAIVALGAVFPVIVNTYAGTKHVDPELVDAGRAFMANRQQLLRTVIVPATAPYVFAGIRIGLGRGVGGVIVAEMTSALTGIGRMLITYAQYLQIAEVYVSIMTLGVVSLLLMKALSWSQVKLVPWDERERV